MWHQVGLLLRGLSNHLVVRHAQLEPWEAPLPCFLGNIRERIWTSRGDRSRRTSLLLFASSQGSRSASDRAQKKVLSQKGPKHRHAGFDSGNRLLRVPKSLSLERMLVKLSEGRLTELALLGTTGVSSHSSCDPTVRVRRSHSSACSFASKTARRRAVASFDPFFCRTKRGPG